MKYSVLLIENPDNLDLTEDHIEENERPYD